MNSTKYSNLYNLFDQLLQIIKDKYEELKDIHSKDSSIFSNQEVISKLQDFIDYYDKINNKNKNKNIKLIILYDYNKDIKHHIKHLILLCEGIINSINNYNSKLGHNIQNISDLINQIIKLYNNQSDDVDKQSNNVDNQAILKTQSTLTQAVQAVQIANNNEQKARSIATNAITVVNTTRNALGIANQDVQIKTNNVNNAQTRVNVTATTLATAEHDLVNAEADNTTQLSDISINYRNQLLDTHRTTYANYQAAIAANSAAHTAATAANLVTTTDANVAAFTAHRTAIDARDAANAARNAAITARDAAIAARDTAVREHRNAQLELTTSRNNQTTAQTNYDTTVRNASNSQTILDNAIQVKKAKKLIETQAKQTLQKQQNNRQVLMEEIKKNMFDITNPNIDTEKELSKFTLKESKESYQFLKDKYDKIKST